jgi:hypothetical protein
MSLTSFNDARASLAAMVSSGYYTVDDLMKLAERVTTDTRPGLTQGSVTLLYSGKIGVVSSGDYITDILGQSEGANLRVLDKTSAGAFLASDEFKTAFAAKATAADYDRLFHPTTGPWNYSSRQRKGIFRCGCASTC